MTQGLPDDIQTEADTLVRHAGIPIVRTVALGTTVLWDRRDRRCEVCMVVRRPSGGLLTFTKAFYPSGLYRLLTGGVEPGESVLDALRREVAEETALDVAIRRFLALAAYRAEDRPGAPLRAFTFAFLLDELGGTLGASDAGEQLAAYGEVAPADLPLIADHLESLPDHYAAELDETWREWGCFRAVVHRVVYEALAR